jgi:SOS-response transcriptional repressor LexA/DNA-binding XRE family transcriptional regulator
VNESEIFAERLKRWRARHKFDQKKAAKVLDIGRTYYSELENGREPGKFLRSKFDVVEFAPVGFVNNVLEEKNDRVREEAGGVTELRSQPLYMYSEQQRSMRVRHVPVIGWAQAGAAVNFEDVIDWEDSVSVEINDPRAIAVRVRGDSMTPEIVEGDIVVLACSDRAQDENIVCARLRDEGVLLKRLKIVDPVAQLFRLISVNPAYPPIDRNEEQFMWIYPVDQIIKRARR